MSVAPQPSLSSAADIDAAADQAIAACGGHAREAVKALIVANDFLDTELDQLRSKISSGYARGRVRTVRDMVFSWEPRGRTERQSNIRALSGFHQSASRSKGRVSRN